MKLLAYPPVIDERAARLAAGVVFLSIAFALLSGQRWVLPILATGFLLRVASGARFSVLARLAAAASRRFGSPVLVAGSPKRFAQGVGAACTLAASVLLWTGMTVAGSALAGVVAACAFAEAAFGFCMGCWVYAQLMKAGAVQPSACVDCAPQRRLQH